MIRNLQTPLLFIRAPHFYTFSSPPPFSRQTKAVPSNKAGYSQVHSARYGQVQNVILTDHKKCYFLHLWCFYFSLQNMFKNLLVVSWLVCWQITIQSLRSKCWQFYETITCENMFWIEALGTWMRVIQRKCNASKNCVWYLYLATTLKFKSRSRNMWFFFVFWEMRVQGGWQSNCWGRWIYEKVFSCQSVNFAPFRQNLGRRAHVHPILRGSKFSAV